MKLIYKFKIKTKIIEQKKQNDAGSLIQPLGDGSTKCMNVVENSKNTLTNSKNTPYIKKYRLKKIILKKYKNTLKYTLKILKNIL